MTTYRVINWDTQQIVLETEHLPTAKRVARNQGHTGRSGFNPAQYIPVARVDEPMRDGSPGYGICYVPVFRVGRDDNFKSVPLAHKVIPGERKCSHGLMGGCSYGCN